MASERSVIAEQLACVVRQAAAICKKNDGGGPMITIPKMTDIQKEVLVELLSKRGIACRFDGEQIYYSFNESKRGLAI